MKYRTFTILLFSLAIISCSSNRNTHSSISDDLVKKLYGYWVSTDSDYQQNDDESERTVLFYGEIDKNKEGVYLQGDLKLKYRIVDTFDYYKKIVIAIYYSNGRERIETLSFSENNTKIKNNITTPDNYSIDTYYIKKNKQ
jgi:antitoxin component YwqK of YwqJK toxin-antitoxin module